MIFEAIAGTGYECIGIERQQNDISRYPPAAKNGETLK